MLAEELQRLENFYVFVKILAQCCCNHEWGAELTWAFVRRPAFYPASTFSMFRELLQSVREIQREARTVGWHTNPEVYRPKSVWTGSAEFFARAYADRLHGWVPGWDGPTGEAKHQKWWNYPLWFGDQEFVRNTSSVPWLRRWIQKHQSQLNVVGFSWFLPGARLAEHTDSTGLLRGSLSFHLGLSGPPQGSCWLKVQNQTVSHVPGRAIVFDSSLVHQAANDHPAQHRVILYVDFRVPWSLFSRGTFSF